MRTDNQVAEQRGCAGEPTAGSSKCGIAQSMLAEFEKELNTTRKFLERVPAARLTWRPHEKSMTAGQLALHIAEVPGQALKLALADEVNPPDFANRPQPRTPGEVLDTLNEGTAFVRQTLPTIDDACMQQTLKIVRVDRTTVSMPRANFLRSIMLNQWYHHRGQFGVYLRLLGALVPSSYGPSGDE